MTSENGSNCPVKGAMCCPKTLCKKFCGLSLDRQLLLINGVLVLVAYVLARMESDLLWLTALVGMVMIFVGLTGMCPIRKMLMKCHGTEGTCEKNSCDKG